jgi:hypothetical protein
MPTTRPRHTITETPPVQEALDELRSKLPKGAKIDYSELLRLGAQVKASRLSAEDAAATAARKRLVEMIRTRSIPVDVDAADEVKRLKLIPKYE